MSLQIVYGTAGSGKSEYCFNTILKEIKNENKIYIITPEQFSFTAEKKLLEKIGTGAVINAEVLTFNRMAYRMMQEVYGATKVHLTDCGKSMLIYDILFRNSKNLKFLAKTDENIEMISTQITEFKKHKIGTEDLKNFMEETDDQYLKAKIKDMEIVYEEFENTMQNKYIDENDMLTILRNNLEKTNIFDDAIFFIDEFVGFTKQEYEIIKKLLQIAKKVTVTACLDNIRVQEAPEIDVFYTCKQTVDRLRNLANDLQVEVEEPIKLEKNQRYKSAELLHLQENLYSIPYKKYEKDVQDINLFLAKNEYSEIENVAINISKLVKEKGYRYNDIGIITQSMEKYSNLCKVIFDKYEIPLFVDEKKDLSQNILVKYILSVLEIFSKNWSHESVFNYLKTGLVDISQNEIYNIENYCIKWGISRNKWYKTKWNFEEQDSNMEQLRKKIVAPLLSFKEKIEQEKTVKNITKCIYNFIIENKIDEKIEEKIEELKELNLLEIAQDYEMSWNIVMQVFDEIVLLFGDEKITFDRYMKILKIGLANSELGNIPATQDQVIIGDVDRTRSHKIKAVFIIGLNDGEFPSVNKAEGFFNDLDRENMKEKGLEMAKGTLERLFEDNFNIYKAFTVAEEKIYLSYSSANLEGKSLRPSILISKIKKIFTKIEEKSDVVNRKSEIITKDTSFDELLNNLRNFRDGKDIDEKWFALYNYYKNNLKYKEKLENAIRAINYTNKAENLSEENVERLYGENLKTSVSKLEQYQSCPFSYYLKYGLKLQEPQEYKIETIDTGSFMHDVLEKFFGKIEKKDLEELKDEEIEEIIEKIIEDKLALVKNYKFRSSPKFIVLTNKLKRVVKKSVKYIIEGLKQSDFYIDSNEVKFEEGAEYDSIKIDLDNGRKVEVIGKIDRLDIAENDGKKYFRIIDYKSSTKDIDLNEVKEGLQIQLLTYLNPIRQKEKANIPAGVLYFNLVNPIIKADKNKTDDEIEQEIRKQFKMKGLILEDTNVIKMMDNKLEKGSSAIIPVRIKDDGTVVPSYSSTINAEKFDRLQKQVLSTIREISKNILDGNIDIRPFYKLKNKKTSCEYCKYKAICNFDARNCGNEYNYIKNINKKEIIENL